MGRYLLGGNPKIVRHLRARALDIVSTLNEPTDVDGQKGAEFPLHIECIAGGLRVMCPRRRGEIKAVRNPAADIAFSCFRVKCCISV